MFAQDPEVLKPPLPLFALARFLSPPKLRSIWLELTVSPSISILAKFR